MKPQNTTSSLPIGKAIYAFRLKNHISQRELAAKMNVSPQAVYKWEHGITYPDITLIPRLARIMGVSIALLFGETDQKIFPTH